MGLTLAAFWWLAAGIAVVVELATGTLYLLMIAAGLVGGAVAAHLGFDATTQVVVAALLGIVATGAWRLRRARRQRPWPASSNRDVNLDIGARVVVTVWGADRTTRVQYRGAGWAARLSSDAAAGPGEHTVTAVEGSCLVLTPT